MREYQERTVQKTERTLSSIRCDLCGCEGEPYGFDSALWEEGYQTTIESRVVYKYENDSEPEHEFDICHECFENKLIPWIKTQLKEPR
jgi:hypothetical protein